MNLFINIEIIIIIIKNDETFPSSHSSKNLKKEVNPKKKSDKDFTVPVTPKIIVNVKAISQTIVSLNMCIVLITSIVNRNRIIQIEIRIISLERDISVSLFIPKTILAGICQFSGMFISDSNFSSIFGVGFSNLSLNAAGIVVVGGVVVEEGVVVVGVVGVLVVVDGAAVGGVVGDVGSCDATIGNAKIINSRIKIAPAFFMFVIILEEI